LEQVVAMLLVVLTQYLALSLQQVVVEVARLMVQVVHRLVVQEVEVLVLVQLPKQVQQERQGKVMQVDMVFIQDPPKETVVVVEVQEQ
jgi:hypothetical protein